MGNAIQLIVSCANALLSVCLAHHRILRSQNDKKSPSLPLLASLISQPFSTFALGSIEFSTSLSDFLTHVFTIHLLPNRFPLESITELSRRLPVTSLDVVNSEYLIAQIPSNTSKVHLLSNLIAFVNPRISKLPQGSLGNYLNIIALALGNLPLGALDPPSKSAQESSWSVPDDSDDSDAEVAPTPRSIPAAPIFSPPIDGRTSKKLQTLVLPEQIATLLSLTAKRALRPPFFRMVLGLCSAWPSKRDKTLSIIVYSPLGSQLIKEIWRDWVRASPLGKDVRQTLDTARGTCYRIWS